MYARPQTLTTSRPELPSHRCPALTGRLSGRGAAGRCPTGCGNPGCGQSRPARRTCPCRTSNRARDDSTCSAANGCHHEEPRLPHATRACERCPVERQQRHSVANHATGAAHHSDGTAGHSTATPPQVTAVTLASGCTQQRPPVVSQHCRPSPRRSRIKASTSWGTDGSGKIAGRASRPSPQR